MGKRANVTLDEIVQVIKAGDASEESQARVKRAIDKMVTKGATNAGKLAAKFKEVYPSFGSGDRRSLLTDLENADIDALLSE